MPRSAERFGRRSWSAWLFDGGPKGLEKPSPGFSLGRPTSRREPYKGGRYSSGKRKPRAKAKDIV
jgi:hypothetical protein